MNASHTPASPDVPSDLLALQTALGHVFQNPALLETALTHPSLRNERGLPDDNQRLEFLGDAVLGFLLADRVFRGYATHPEGLLTVLRASVASGTALAGKARGLALGPALRLGHGEGITGGADRDSNLADALEAVLGAVYLDEGIAAVSRVFDRLFADDLAGKSADPRHDNPKGRLQHLAQRDYRIEPEYEVIDETGPRHAREFRVRATVGDAASAEGRGATKRLAQSAAAEHVLMKLDRT